MSDGLARAWRFITACLLVVATLGFGLVGLCGGVFTVISATVKPAFIGIALPSLLIGGGLACLCAWLLLRSPREDA